MITSFEHSKRKDLQWDVSEKKIDTDYELEELWRHLRSTFDTIKDHFYYYVFPDYIRWYKHKFLYNGDRYQLLKQLKMTDKSNKKRPLIASVHDTYFSNTYDTRTRIKCVPVGEEDVEKATAAQSYMEWGFSIDSTDEAVKEMDWESILVWPWFGRVWFNNVDDTKFYVQKNTEKSYRYRRQNPTANYVDIFSLFYNPNATNFYTVPKFYRDIMWIWDAKDKYSWYFNITDEEWKYIVWHPQYFDDKDYKWIKKLQRFDDTMKFGDWSCITNPSCLDTVLAQKDKPDDSIFNDEFSVDRKTEVIEVVEYREKDRFVLLFNWYIVFDWPSPYPFEGDPFVMTQYKTIPWTLFPIWLSQMLDSIQINVDNFINSRVDSINWMVNTPYVADKWVFWDKTPEILRMQPRKVYQRVWWKIIEPLRMTDPAVVNHLLSWIQFFNAQAYEKVGLNSYTQWWQWKIERTAWGVSSRTQILKTALVPFYSNKNKMLSKMAEKRMGIWMTLLDDKFKVRVMWDNYDATFKEISKTDLIWQFDFYFDNESLKSISKNEERQDLMQWLQYVKSWDTASVLEDKLLWTFESSKPTIEEKKQQIEEDLELEKYAQEKRQEMWMVQQEQQQWWWQQQDMQQAMQAMGWWGSAMEVPTGNIDEVPEEMPTWGFERATITE